jgi:acyl-coenzyme A thioesterase PaaI-like protein
MNMKLVTEDQDWASMPALPPNFKLSSFDEATSLTPIPSPDNNTYQADLKRDWAIGLGISPFIPQNIPLNNTVPHGGYLASILARAVKQYFQTNHRSLNQPDLITFHIEFLNRSIAGPATIIATPLKLGRQFSTVRVQLLQPDKPTPSGKQDLKLCIEALITQGNLIKESISGAKSLPTHPVIKKEDIPKRELCEPWIYEPQFLTRRPAAFKADLLLPPGSDSMLVHPTQGPSVREFWTKWKPSNGKSFDISAVCYLADSFRPLPESYGTEMRGNWYPTLSYGLDVKRKWKEGKEGWEWLFLRIVMRECIDGRFIYDVVICDEKGDVVAISTHTALIVGFERNAGKAKGKL